MARRKSDHLNVVQAFKRGMTIDQWWEHEEAENALDTKERDTLTILLVLFLFGWAVCSILALLWMGVPIG